MDVRVALSPKGWSIACCSTGNALYRPAFLKKAFAPFPQSSFFPSPSAISPHFPLSPRFPRVSAIRPSFPRGKTYIALLSLEAAPISSARAKDLQKAARLSYKVEV
jgi:hypothetical protein